MGIPPLGNDVAQGTLTLSVSVFPKAAVAAPSDFSRGVSDLLSTPQASYSKM